jgi:hypothetical protein
VEPRSVTQSKGYCINREIADIVKLLSELESQGIRWMHVELLNTVNKQIRYASG